MSSPRPSSATLRKLQKSTHEAYEQLRYGDMKVPSGWLRVMYASRRNQRTRWIRMITLTIHIITKQPTVTVTDIKLLEHGQFLYVPNEEFTLAKMNPTAFMRSLTRVTDAALKVEFLDAEEHARAFLTSDNAEPTLSVA